TGSTSSCRPRDERAWCPPRRAPARGAAGRSIGGRRAAQNWSAETTSPPLREPMAHQTSGLTVLLTARTVPSPNRTLTMPGCGLLAVWAPLPLLPLASVQDHVFGGITWL